MRNHFKKHHRYEDWLNRFKTLRHTCKPLRNFKPVFPSFIAPKEFNRWIENPIFDWFQRQKNLITLDEMWKKLQCHLYEREWKKDQYSYVIPTDSQNNRELSREKIVEELVAFFSSCKENKMKETKKVEDNVMIRKDKNSGTENKAIQVDADDIDKYEGPKSLIKWLVNVVLHKIMFTAISLKDVCRQPNLKWHTDDELDIQLKKIFPLASLFWPPFEGEEPQERPEMFRKVLNRMARNYTKSQNLRRHIRVSYYTGCEPKISTYWNELLR
ncbi:hypothetical protein TNIN_20681 [Trichonephila inaurata madagascariensis]|uniref:Uncharacterized protein n=1 Tax=Trichonephila inaurata madagascariensis TaxID=2747483 RepID=A0A8X6IWJ0_9ARAC|nr:hypothetical protein TNIN_20681 [Trichonephila inaurata madagascariensis]